jgi:hypothetical protein
VVELKLIVKAAVKKVFPPGAAADTPQVLLRFTEIMEDGARSPYEMKDVTLARVEGSKPGRPALRI